MWHDSVCNTVQEPTVTSTIVAKKTTTWGESGFPSEFLGECIAPYVALDPLKAALPVHRPTMTMPLNHSECKADKHSACRLDVESLHQSMKRRWNIEAEMFHEAHENQVINDLYDRLNYQKILTSQGLISEVVEIE